MTGTRGARAFLLVYGYLTGLRKADLVYATGHDVPLPPVPLSYGVITAGAKAILFDAGASRAWADRKRVVEYRPPAELLARVGLRVEDVTDVVLSHLHWDHATAAPMFDRATFWVQRSEFDGWVRSFAAPSDMDWVHQGRVEPALLEALEGTQRVALIDGDRALADGISIHLAEGHTFGTQCMTISTADGPVVLASDVVFTYENVERMIPLGNGLDQIAMLRSMARAKELSEGGLLVPGHDPRALDTLEMIERGVFRVC